jgi:hypothetical protein
LQPLLLGVLLRSAFGSVAGSAPPLTIAGEAPQASRVLALQAAEQSTFEHCRGRMLTASLRITPCMFACADHERHNKHIFINSHYIIADGVCYALNEWTDFSAFLYGSPSPMWARLDSHVSNIKMAHPKSLHHRDGSTVNCYRCCIFGTFCTPSTLAEPATLSCPSLHRALSRSCRTHDRDSN